MNSSISVAKLEAQFIVGVDGGGSGTRARLCDLHGHVLGFGQAGPSGLGQGVEQAWVHIGQAIAAAFHGAQLSQPGPEQIALGLGLAGSEVSAQSQAFFAQAPRYARVVLDNDGYTTVLGAHAGRPGVVVAAGTGTVGEVLRADGTRHRVSGWGWMVGDEGGGAWLGKHAMQHAMQACDGRAPTGPLARAVWAKVAPPQDSDPNTVANLTNFASENILTWCAVAGQNQYAQLAPLVFECAQTDLAASGLLSAAVHELETIAAALDGDGCLPLVVCGSVGQRLLPLFKESTRQRCVSAAGDSADGALLLIRQALGLPANLQTQQRSDIKPTETSF